MLVISVEMFSKIPGTTGSKYGSSSDRDYSIRTSPEGHVTFMLTSLVMLEPSGAVIVARNR